MSETISTVTEVLFILLGLVLVVLALKNPKYVFITFPIEVLKVFTKYHLWEGFIASKDDKHDFEYKKESVIHLKFDTATKLILITSSDSKSILNSACENLELISDKTRITEDRISHIDNYRLLHLPDQLSFYSYNYLIQALDNDGFDNVGFVDSQDIKYVLYQDKNSLNNLIGETDNLKKVSVSMYKGFEDGAYLVVNSKIKLDKLKRYMIVDSLMKKAGNKM